MKSGKKQNKTRFAILVMLSIEPMSGYDMKKFTEEVVSHFWSESYGQIYTNLKKLVRDGWITYKEEKEGNKPAKKIYEITDLGMSELVDWLSEPTEEQVPRNELSLKFFVAPLASPETLLKHIKLLRASHKKKLEALKQAIKRMEEQVPDEVPHKGYWLVGSRMGILTHEAKLAWCDEVEAFIRKQHQPNE